MQLPGERTIDNDHGGSTTSGCLAPGDIKLRLQYRSDSGDHYWKVLRAAASHHRIHRNFFQRHRGVTRLDDPQGMRGVSSKRPQHFQHELLRGWHNGQSIGPAPLLVVILDGGKRVRHLYAA
jgi:hypothetical protein